MIILHSKKLIIFRVPKTGSSSMQYNLIRSAMYDETTDLITPKIEDSNIQKLHTTPQVAYDNGLITDEMLAEYKMYAVIRKPSDRFMSAIGHQIRPARVSPIRVKSMVSVLGIDALSKIFKLPQVNWFTINGERVVTPILYDNYEAEFAEIYAGYDVEVGTIVRNAGTVRATTEEIFEDEDLTDTINSINEYYADDWALYNYTLETELVDR